METFGLFTSAVGAHWPFVAVALLLAVFGQVLKGAVWTEANFLRYRQTGVVRWRFFWWGRKTLPLHPVIVGALLGLVKTLPAGPGVSTPAARMLYFAFAGIASAWAFGVLKSLAKKQGIDISVGVSEPPKVVLPPGPADPPPEP